MSKKLGQILTCDANGLIWRTNDPKLVKCKVFTDLSASWREDQKKWLAKYNTKIVEGKIVFGCNFIPTDAPLYFYEDEYQIIEYTKGLITVKELNKIYKKVARQQPKIKKLHNGRYRYEIWRQTGLKEDDNVVVDEVGTFAGPKTANKFAYNLTKLTGVTHYSAEYDATQID